MAPLIPIETLSYYLSKTGITKFKVWFNSIELFKPIHEELDALTNIIEQSRWLEDKIRKQTFTKIKTLIINFIENINNKNPEVIFQEWIDSIQNKCFQGGYGYRIQYSGNVPHHWCVRCEYYESVSVIPEIVALCGIVCDKYINLSETADYMIWSG
jgi:hypothetical protein